MLSLGICCVSAAGHGRGRGRGRPLAVADNVPVVGLDASAMANSLNEPHESASTEPKPQRGGRGKATLQVLRSVGQREPKVPAESQKVDVLPSTVSPLLPTDVGGRRVIDASNENIVISFSSNSDTDAVVAPAVSVIQKPPKIGSGRLSGKTEAVGGRKLRGKRGKGHLVQRAVSAEEPVTIGIAVIRTPSDQPNIEYKAVDEKPKLKGILKRTQLERHEDWVEEPVETVDWDRELEEAQRRKDELLSSGPEGSTATIETVVKENDAGKLSLDMSDVDADDDDEWEDVEEDDEVLEEEDLHDISAESFDKFIKEHTLKLDVALATPDVTEWTTKDPSGSITTGSQDSFLKTPVGQTRVVDWGAEMDQLSQSEKQRRMSVELGELYFSTVVTSGLLD